MDRLYSVQKQELISRLRRCGFSQGMRPEAAEPQRAELTAAVCIACQSFMQVSKL
jgi:hypothetical protein